MACAAAITLQAQRLGNYVDRVWHLAFDACAVTCWAAIAVFSVACSLNFLGLYLDGNGEAVAVVPGLNDWWIVARGRHRVKSQAMPPRRTADACQRDLDAYAIKQKWQAIEEADTATIKERNKPQMQEIIFKKTSDLKPHALNAAIYGDGADSDLLESIKKHGILTPILITESGLVISGHRRLNAAQMVGLEMVPVTVVDALDQLEEEELLIMTNRQRQKTNEQKMREGKKLLEIVQERARRRSLTNLKQNQNDNTADPQKSAGREYASEVQISDPQKSAGREYASEVQISAPRMDATGESRKVVAETIGVSHDTLTKGVAVVETIDELKAAGQEDKANELRETLNKKSVNAAHKKVKGETLVKCADCRQDVPKSTITREICTNCLENRRQLWACVFGAPIPDYPAEITQCAGCEQMVLKDSTVIDTVNGVQQYWCRWCCGGASATAGANGDNDIAVMQCSICSECDLKTNMQIDGDNVICPKCQLRAGVQAKNNKPPAINLQAPRADVEKHLLEKTAYLDHHNLTENEQKLVATIRELLQRIYDYDNGNPVDAMFPMML